MNSHPPRSPWNDFPDVLIHASESSVKTHGTYAAAKSGNGMSAELLVKALMSSEQNEKLQQLVGDQNPTLGGTLANLKGYIESQGGIVIAAVSLTGKPYSAKLNPSPEQLLELREKHGTELEHWWQTRFAHGWSTLTHSEARYLARTQTAGLIRDRIAAASQA